MLLRGHIPAFGAAEVDGKGIQCVFFGGAHPLSALIQSIFPSRLVVPSDCIPNIPV